MSHRGPELSRQVKYWIRPNLESHIREDEIQVYFGSTVGKIRADAISVTAPQGRLTLKNDFVFALTGYRPDLKWLSSMGIDLDTASHRAPTDPGTLESVRPGI